MALNLAQLIRLGGLIRAESVIRSGGGLDDLQSSLGSLTGTTQRIPHQTLNALWNRAERSIEASRRLNRGQLPRAIDIPSAAGMRSDCRFIYRAIWRINVPSPDNRRVAATFDVPVEIRSDTALNRRGIIDASRDAAARQQMIGYKYQALHMLFGSTIDQPQFIGVASVYTC